ncbi:CBS domain-containing protein [Candidatus Roizmanbacteria bacterium]|nr:CBS domain-containing protein [Candidatus Roizmanbacteria bacterium]
MIYFSELKNKVVFTEDKVEVGKLEDLIFLASEKPNVTKVVIRDLRGNKLVIPVAYLKKINDKISIRKDFQTTELTENELHLVKNMLDKQIIDLQGNKIVRVNDIALQDKDGFYIAGVDIGILGILRWLNLEKLLNKIALTFRLKLSSPVLSWADIQPLELTYGKVKLRKEEKRLEKLHPEDLADYLEKTNIVNVRKILKMLDEKFAADVIEKLNINYQTALFKGFSPDKAAKIISLLDSDEAVDVLLTLSHKRRDQVLEFIPEKKKSELIHLLKLSTTPIGNLISTEYVVVYPDTLVSEVFQKIKKDTGDFSYFNHVYVVNKKDELIGVFNLHELLLQSHDAPVYRFMIQNVIVTHLTTPGPIAIKKMLKYKLGSLPVIDDDKRLLGIITITDVINTFGNG